MQAGLMTYCPKWAFVSMGKEKKKQCPCEGGG